MGDFTNAFNGRHAEAVIFLEQGLGHRLVGNSCMLHTNELPLRHLVIDLDGPTTGQDSFSGPICKLCNEVTTLPRGISSLVLLV